MQSVKTLGVIVLLHLDLGHRSIICFCLNAKNENSIHVTFVISASYDGVAKLYPSQFKFCQTTVRG